MKRFINQLTPFIMLGIAAVAFAFGLMIFVYLLLFGAAVGLILFGIAWIRNVLNTTPKKVSKKESGRIIDIKDWKEMR